MIELIYLIFNIAGGIFGGLMAFNIPVNQMQGMNLIENNFKFYDKFIVILMIFTYFFVYIKEAVRIILSKMKIISEKIDLIFSIIYSIIFIVTLYLMNGFKELMLADGSVMIAVIAVLAALAVGKTYKMNECYALKLLLQHDDKVQKKNQMKMICIGGVFGIIASVVLIIANAMYVRYNVFLVFLATVALFIVYDLIYQKINYKIYFKLDYNDRYLEDFGVYAFKLFSMISYWIVLATIFKLSFLYSLLFAYILKILHKPLLVLYEDGGTTSSYSSNQNIKVEKNIFGDNIYKKDGKVVATGKFNVFGDEEITDNNYNTVAIGKKNVFGDTNYTDNKYNNLGQKREGFFNNEIRDASGKTTYTEEKDIWGDSILHKK